MKILIEKAPLEDIGEAAYRLALSYKGFSISKEAYMEKFSELLNAALREALAEQVGQEPVYCTYPKCNCINPTLCRAQNITAEQAEQEPVLSYHIYDIHTKLGHEFFYEEYKWHKDKPRAVLNQNIKIDLYAAPVRTKNLTDEEIYKLADDVDWAAGAYLGFARAVIAADREKNK